MCFAFHPSSRSIGSDVEDAHALREARPPWLVRFGATVGAAALGSLLAAGPGALRMASTGDVGIARAWLTLAGLLLFPMCAIVPVVRLARDALRGIVRPERALERVASATVFACTWLWSLSVLGAMLREKTHQRSLGAVTFAIFAVVSAAALALVARRLATILGALRDRRRETGTLMCAAAIALPLIVLGMRIVRAAPHLDDGARAMLVDGIAVALAAAFSATTALENRRLVARVGPPAAVCFLVVTMHTLATDLPASVAIQHVCPLYFALLSAFARLGA